MGGDVVIHIGVHKTGSTSIQAFLETHRTRLLAHGLNFYSGTPLPSNHVELHLAAMREDRLSPYKLTHKFQLTDEFTKSVVARLERHLAEPGTKIFSNEGISFLRFPDEFERLHRLFPGQDLRIVAYLRDKAEWRQSYAAEMRKRNLPSEIDATSFAYLGEDSWLLDFEERIGAFRNYFGASNVTVLDYDKCLAEDGTVIPSFLRYLGAEQHFGTWDWSAFWANRSNPAPDPQG